MARIASEIIYKLIADEKDLVSGLKAAEKSTAEFGKKLESAGKKLTLGLTAPILAAGAASIKLASELQDSQNAVNVIFQDGAEIIQDYGKTAAETAGLSISSFNDVANSIGVLLAQTGKPLQDVASDTVTLTQRAADLASLLGGTTKEAALALGAALRGESEPARRYGIILSEATIQAKALELGIGGVNGELTEAEKVQVRYNVILEQSARAQGDFAKTSDDAKNSSEVLKANISNLAADLGTQLLPAVESALTFARDLIKQFTGLDQNGKRLAITIGAIAAALGPVLTIAGKLIAGGPIALGLAAIAGAIGIIAAGTARAKAEAQGFKDALAGAADLQTLNQFIQARQKEIEQQKQLIAQNDALGARGRVAADAARARLAELQKELSLLVQNYNGKQLNIKAQEEINASEAEAAKRAEEKAKKDAEAALAKSNQDAAALKALDDKKEKEAALAEEEQNRIQAAIDNENILLDIEAQSREERLAALEAYDAERERLHQEELARIAAEEQARIAAQKFIYSQLTALGDQLLQNELDRINQSELSEEDKAIAIAKIKRKQALLDRAQALVDIATNTAVAITKTLPNVFLASVIGALGAVQAAAVLSQPLPEIPSFAQGTRNFMVPPGFPNDSFPILVQSGERVTVETPQQQAGGGGDRPIFQIGTVIADPAGLRELDSLLRKYGTVETIRRG